MIFISNYVTYVYLFLCMVYCVLLWLEARGFVDVIVDSGAFLRFLHFIHNASATNQVR